MDKPKIVEAAGDDEVDGVSMRDKGRFDGDGDNDGELVGGDPG
jgi:hypothetical protein